MSNQYCTAHDLMFCCQICIMQIPPQQYGATVVVPGFTLSSHAVWWREAQVTGEEVFSGLQDRCSRSQFYARPHASTTAMAVGFTS